jgi:hypothetical protein
VQTPAAGAEVLPEVVDASADFVLHTTAAGFAPIGLLLPDGNNAFGAGLGASLSVDPETGIGRPYDASGYAGLDFTFSMAFPPTTPVQLAVLVATSATTPPESGGTCTAACFDDFALVGAIPFSPFFFSGGFTWDQLAQQGFGTPAEFDPATIVSIKWLVQFPNSGQPAAADNFDFQLDDVAFFTDAATAGIAPAAPEAPPPGFERAVAAPGWPR